MQQHDGGARRPGSGPDGRDTWRERRANTLLPPSRSWGRIRSPASPHSAGRSVSAATSITRTASAAQRPSIVTYGMPARARPAVARHTTIPENRTAGPVEAHRAYRGLSLVRRAHELLAISRGEEQPVVDPDAESDHRGEVGRGGSDGEEVREHVQQEDAGAQARERVDEREQGRENERKSRIRSSGGDDDAQLVGVLGERPESAAR